MNFSTKRERPLILLTNDDGIESPGIRAAAEAVLDLGDLIIAAPAKQQSGMGRAFPRLEDTGIIETSCIRINGQEIPAYGVHGSPALAVAHGILEIADRKPDLCISGINYGENLGQTVTCSGTLGAAIEAASQGIPAIAVSLEANLSIQRLEQLPGARLDTSGEILRAAAQRILAKENVMQADIWNINVPAEAEDPKDYRITTQSRQNYFCFQKPQKRDFSRPFRLTSKISIDMDTLERDSDIYAVYVDRKISVTPLTIDMTAGRTGI